MPHRHAKPGRDRERAAINLAQALQQLGQDERAVALAAEVRAIVRELGEDRLEPVCDYVEAVAAARRGDTAAARAAFEAGEETVAELGWSLEDAEAELRRQARASGDLVGLPQKPELAELGEARVDDRVGGARRRGVSRDCNEERLAIERVGEAVGDSDDRRSTRYRPEQGQLADAFTTGEPRDVRAAADDVDLSRGEGEVEVAVLIAFADQDVA